MALTTYKTVTVLGLLAAGLGAAFIGCSSDDTNNPGPGVDGGKDTGPSGNGPKQTGTIVSFSNQSKVNGATVTLGAGSGTTAQGAYSIAVTAGSPFFMRVSRDTFTTLLEQEWQLSGDADRGPTAFIETGTTNVLKGALTAGGAPGNEWPAINTAKGVLGIGIVKTAGCDDDGQVTLRIDTGEVLDAGADSGSDAGDDGGSDAGATDAGSTDAGPKPDANSNVVRYFASATGFAPKSQPQQTKAGQITPSAVIYNVTPGDTVRVIATHPTCKQVTTFPYADPTAPNIKYTGRIKVEAGDTIFSFARIFMIKP